MVERSRDASTVALPTIVPDWDAPPGVAAFTTTREGGVSVAPYDSMNVALHVGDAPEAVEENRRRLARGLGLPAPPEWLVQVHGRRVVRAEEASDRTEADAMMTQVPGAVCAVQTADCLPVLLASVDGRAVAAAHAGWRGVVGGVLEATVESLGVDPATLVAWIGPGIGRDAFEVGCEVREAFVTHSEEAEAAFRRKEGGRWLADLPLLAGQRLAAAGVERVRASGLCTVSDSERFFSYRRDGTCGRLATLVWIEE